VRLSAACLRQIDPLPRPKDSAFPGLYIGRSQPQSNIERIDAERGPEGKLADPMLFRVTGGPQRNGVAIARLPPYTTIGSCTPICGV
jgi:hypothetical protein